ncbi:MAG: S41 family peptidase [Gemmatimonadota bacterium]|jgi:hypothetical protein
MTLVGWSLMRRIRLAVALLVTTVAVAASGCTDLLVPASPEDHNIEDFEAAWTFIDSLYPMFTEKGIDWDSVYAWYRPRAETAHGDEGHQILHDLVATLRDGHAYYQTVGGGVVFPFVSPRLRRDRPTFSPYVVRRYVRGELKLAANRKLEYGFLEGNLGYLRLPTFDPGYLLDDFAAVMRDLSDTEALVIDVRNNVGGKLKNVAGVVRWFVDSTMRWSDGFSQREILKDIEPPIEPADPAPGYGGPVVVLINGGARSAGDIFPELMRQLPRVTLVGDTTAGMACQDASDLEGDLRLPGGNSIHIPTECLRRYDAVPIERFGVPADLRVTQTEDDVRAGRDPQLERAIALLRASGAHDLF